MQLVNGSNKKAGGALVPAPVFLSDKQLNDLAEAADLKLDRASIEKLNEASSRKAIAGA